MAWRWRWLGCVLCMTSALGACMAAPDEGASEEPSEVGENTPDAGSSNAPTGSDDGPGGPSCQEQRTPVTGAQTTAVGPTAGEFVALLAGSHASTLTWANGASTVIDMKLTGLRVFSVLARAKADRGRPTRDLSCANHARIEARLSFRTRDGMLNETVEHVTLHAFGLDAVHGSFEIDGGELRGDYEPNLPRAYCYLRSSFRALFRPDGIHGAMVDVVSAASCKPGTTAGRQSYAAGHWGSHWQGI